MTSTTAADPSTATVVDTHLLAYAETDPARRQELVQAAWHPDGELVDPPARASGHAGIAGLYAALAEQFPGHRFRRSTELDGHHDAVRYGWELVAPDGSVALAGLDVAVLGDDGRLARVTGFFGTPAAA